MTDQRHDDELFSLVRQALREPDDDTLSPTGAQARSVLDRVLARREVTLLDQGAQADEATAIVRPHRRRVRLVFAVPAAGAIAAVAAALLVISLVGAPVTPHGGTTGRGAVSSSHGVAAVRARLLAALTANGNDVLQEQITTSSDAPGSTACTSTAWMAPFDAQTGQEFRVHSESSSDCGGVLDSEIDIPIATVVPLATSFPIYSQLPPPAGTPPTQFFTGEVGNEVCGVGSETGYSTGFASDNGAFQASSVMLGTGIDVTPELIQSQLSAGTLSLIGDATIDGQAAIELSVVPPARDEVASNWGSETLWVDPTTYLPIRQVLQLKVQALPAGAPAPPVAEYPSEQVRTFTFLPPTQANLALLQVSIPAELPQIAAPGAGDHTNACASSVGTTGNSGATGTSGTGNTGTARNSDTVGA